MNDRSARPARQRAGGGLPGSAPARRWAGRPAMSGTRSLRSKRTCTMRWPRNWRAAASRPMPRPRPVRAVRPGPGGHRPGRAIRPAEGSAGAPRRPGRLPGRRGRSDRGRGLRGRISWLLAASAAAGSSARRFRPAATPSADCARWLAGDPSARTCLTAMVADHVNDILLQGLAGGLARDAAAGGLLVDATAVAGPQHAHRAAGRQRRSRGAILAVLVTLGTPRHGLDAEMVQGGQGAGHPFSLAAAALGAAAFFAARLYRRSGRARAARRPV